MLLFTRLAELRRLESRGYLTLNPRVFMIDVPCFLEVGMMYRICSSFTASHDVLL